MKIEAGFATDVGRVREGNEDAYLVEPPLYAVADGMGGHRGGDVASQLALATIEDLSKQGKGSLGEQVREANRLVFERAAEDRRLAGMGTTLTAAVISPEGAHLAHVGDSRAYMLRAGALRRLTEDHTLVNRMVRAGEISEKEAEQHPHRNVLVRALGTEPDVDVDEESVGLLDADRLVLCSDGLTGMVAEEQIQAILEAAATPQEAADRLVRTANRAGGVDNITVLVLDVSEAEAGPGGTTAGGGTAARAARAGIDRSTLLRWAARAAVGLAVVLALLFGVRAFVESQWYVGIDDGDVAVFQGIPAEALGFQLSHVEVQTTIPAADVTDNPLWSNLPNGLTAPSREEALQIVEEMRAFIATAEEQPS
jgi:serine/threonine protein phosphatase PrpC